MIIKPNWNIFRAKFSDSQQNNFEWFCYLLFSKEYNQPYGIHRYKNQSGIETDPIKIEDEIIGWQSKFYEVPKTETLNKDLKSTLEKAKRDYPNITKIVFYTNMEWSKYHKNKDTKAEKTKAQKEIEELYKKEKIELILKMDSYFESSFVCIENSNISKYFFIQESFVPYFELISERTKLNIKGVGKRYAPNDVKYEFLNQTMPISNIFNFIDNYAVMQYINNITNDFLHNRPFTIKSDILSYIKTLKSDIPKEIDKLTKFIQYLEADIEGTMDDPSYIQELDRDDINIKYNKINKLQKTINSQKALLRKISSKDLLFYEKNILLISGEALIGKTHLFCDIALNRLEKNQQTLLFFGNKFESNKPIVKNMIEQLGLSNINQDNFLESLDLWANKYGDRTLIMIDAINETENLKIWQEGIIQFCEQIKSYPNLALAMSIRDVEKNKVITSANEEFIANEIVEIEHKGFEGIELEAVRTFCEALEVEFPKVPIHIYRLFVNPGMLFLYIETIKNSTKKVDTSIINPLTIFKSYVEDLERKYYQKYPHDIDEEDEVVSEAIEEFISLGTEKDYLHFYLNYKEVKKKLKPLHNKILKFLISEGVLNKLKQESGTRVYFTYQKFENFFIADYLLDNFDRNREKIFKLIKEYNGAISEALFMQIPEKLSQDIFNLNVWFIRDEYICQTYLKSLVWRNPNTINDMTFKYINFILYYHNLSSIFLDTILQLSSIPNHPLNILRLHKVLLQFNLSERDYEWSIYLHDSYKYDKIVKRIINWAWDKKEEFEIEDESLYLYGLTLGWFLTSPNRELRDGTTKALVNLFTDKVDVFLNVLKEFETVDDLYVLERLYAVGYGIVLRSSEQNRFKELGEYIYQTIFDKDKVIEHIFLRDYAKLTVEYINNLVSLEIDMNKVMPPYNQHLDWDLLDENIENIEKYQDNYSQIYFSTLKGDFKRYVIYSYANHFFNLKMKNRPHPKMQKVRYDDFFNSLSEIQKDEYDKTRVEPNEMLDILKFNDFESKIERLKEKKLNQSNFKALLSAEQLKEFNDFIVNYKTKRYKNGLDVKVVKKLVFLEVIKLGWKKELFEDYDNNANFDRGADKGTERIGKKYQWIALYKILAKLLDTYEFKEDEFKKLTSKYKGMYQFSFKRDIDPSTILKFKKENKYKWWFNIDTTFENYELSDTEWMNSCEKLPKLSQIVNLTKDNKNYLLLDTNFSIDGNKERKTYRNLYYHVNSFVIKKDKQEEITDWIKNQNFYARRMPESKYFHDPYLREYPNSEAYNNIDNDYNRQPNWDNTFKDSDNNIPDEVLLTATGYFKERREPDYSITDSIEIKLPNKWFVNTMKLKQTLRDGEWINEQEEVVFLDPTVDSGNISTFNENGVLIADRKLLFEFLEKNGYTIFWILWGEKQIQGGKHEDFLGIGEISGYGYFEGDEFIENIDVNWEGRK